LPFWRPNLRQFDFRFRRNARECKGRWIIVDIDVASKLGSFCQTRPHCWSACPAKTCGSVGGPRLVIELPATSRGRQAWPITRDLAPLDMKIGFAKIRQEPHRFSKFARRRSALGVGQPFVAV
jgi:hypothetical protein